MPLLWPDVPPLIDLPGHMGRYKVQMGLDPTHPLERFYDIEWSLIGNLGVDLLVIPLAKLLGLEAAVKLIVLTIPPMTAAGFLWVAREVHGRVPPTALLALPFAYGHPFIFGFVNFALSMALAFLAFGLWLRLARLGRLRLRAALFVPISLLIWLTHTFGWGALGVMAFSAELVRQHDRGRGLIAAAFHSGIQCLSLAPPILPVLLWRTGHVGGMTLDWFNFRSKFYSLLMVLRDRWPLFDILALVVSMVVIGAAIISRKIGFSRNLAASAIFLLIAFLLLPRIVFGSAYADMRLTPFLLAVGLIAVRLRPNADYRMARRLALLGLAFFLIRIGGNTVSFWLYDLSYDRELAALDHVPRGARLLSLVGKPCGRHWKASRLEHLPGLAMVRRDAFSNDQWTMPGAQLIRVRFPEGRGFRGDPSQIVTRVKCRRELWRTVDRALERFPREGFDYVWLIDPPPYDPALTQGLRPIWRSGTSVLFQVQR